MVTGTLQHLMPLTSLLVEALLNGFLQGLFLFLAVWIALRFVPATQAALRFNLQSLALLLLLLLPVVHLLRVRAETSPRVPTGAGPLARSASAEESGLPILAPGILRDSSNPPRGSAVRPGYRNVPLVWPGSFTIQLSSGIASVVGFALWIAIAGVLLARMAWSYLCLRKLKGCSAALQLIHQERSRRWTTDLGPGRPADVRASEEVALPMLAGLSRPAILFPEQLLKELSDEELHAIWLHEMAHVRRWDDWTNLGQRFAEAILFFHPAAHWMSKGMSRDREIASDEWVVRRTGEPRSYAACLTRLVEMVSLSSHRSPALGMAADRKQIIRRIEMLIDVNRKTGTRLSTAAAVAVVTLLAGASLLVASLSPRLLLAQTPPSASTSTQDSAGPSPSPSGGQDVAPAPAPRSTFRSGAAGRGLRHDGDTEEVQQTVRQLMEELRPLQEEILKLSQEIGKEVQDSIQPKTAEIQKMTEQITGEVQARIQPQMQEISRLAGQIADEQMKGADPATIRKLEDQIQAKEKEIRLSEEKIRNLEKPIHELEIRIRPSEEQMRVFEAKIHELEQRMNAQVKEHEERLRLLQEKFEHERRAPEPQVAPTPPPPPPSAAPPSRGSIESPLADPPLPPVAATPPPPPVPATPAVGPTPPPPPVPATPAATHTPPIPRTPAAPAVAPTPAAPRAESPII